MSKTMLVMPDENDDEDEDHEDHVLLKMVLDGNHNLVTLVARVL